MEGNNPEPTIIHTDVTKIIHLATTSIDQALELIKLLPIPLQIDEDSKLYKSLEEIRNVPLVSSMNKADFGVQVDFISQGLETIIGDTNTFDDYEIITSETHFDAVNPSEIQITGLKQDDVTKCGKIIDEHNYAAIELELEQLDGTVTEQQKSENKGTLQDEGAISISFIESEQETYIDNDAETISLKSNNSTLQNEDYSQLNEDTTLSYTDRSDTSDTSVKTPNEPENDTLVASVAISNDNENSDINETNITVVHSDIKTDTDKGTIKQEESNMQQSPEKNEEKTPTKTTERNSSKKDSILNLVKPRDYKPKPREKVTVFGNWEDVQKLLKIAAKCIAENNYFKAKRMADKAERIHPTPAAKALLEQIRIVTEARESAERVKERTLEKATKTTPENAEKKAKKVERALKEAAQKAIYEEKAAAEKAERETFRKISKFLQDSSSKTSIEKGQEVVNSDQNAKVSGAESLNPDPNSESPDSNKKRRAEGMMSVAQAAHSQGDITKAEKLAQKAQKLHPCAETDRFLEKIRNKLSENATGKKENSDPNIKKTSQNLSESDMKSETIKNFAAHISNPELKANDPKYRADNFVVIARNATADGNYDKAERFLKKANSEYSSEITEKLLQQLLIERSNDAKKSNNQKYNSYVDNMAEAESLYNQARKELSQKNFNVALAIAVKSQKLNRLAKTEALIKEINKAFDVEKCIEVAMKALAEEDLEKAERLLMKAQRIQPTGMAKELLEDFQHGLEHRKKESLANEAKAEQLVSCAMTAVDDEDYEFVEVILTTAWIRHKSQTAKKMLRQVEEIIARQKFQKQYKERCNMKYEEKQISAEKYMKLAQSMMSHSNENLENAEDVLIIAQNTYYTIHGNLMLTRIRTTISGDPQKCLNKNFVWNYSPKNIQIRESFKCNVYVEMAKRAYERGDYDVANEFLLEAKKLFPLSPSIKKLIKQVEDARKQKLRASGHLK